MEAHDAGKAGYEEHDKCDQEGCSEKATVYYKKKFDYCNRGHKSEIVFNVSYRQFCNQHKTRGDCGLDDADDNYIKISREELGI